MTNAKTPEKGKRTHCQPKTHCAGSFAQIGGVNASQVAAWDGSSWSAIVPPLDRNDVNVVALDTVSRTLYLGGSITQGGQTCFASSAVSYPLGPLPTPQPTPSPTTTTTTTTSGGTSTGSGSTTGNASDASSVSVSLGAVVLLLSVSLLVLPL